MITRPWAENIWFSPSYVINELARTVATRDKNKIKRANEAWVCAVAMICHSKHRPVEWWIQVPKNDPPDVLAMNFISHEGGLGQNMSMLYVEVFEISEHDNESIEKSIERKLGTKDYL